MKIGFTELLLVFVVALLVLGPDKLPSFAKKLGAGLKAFRTASGEITKEIKESVIDPLEKAQEPIREAMKPLEDLDKEVNANLKDVTKSLENLGKSKPSPAKKTEEAKSGTLPKEEAPPEADQKFRSGETAPEENHAPEQTRNESETENGGLNV